VSQATHTAFFSHPSLYCILPPWSSTTTFDILQGCLVVPHCRRIKEEERDCGASGGSRGKGGKRKLLATQSPPIIYCDQSALWSSRGCTLNF
jgi:hypothetical protein